MECCINFWFPVQKSVTLMQAVTRFRTQERSQIVYFLLSLRAKQTVVQILQISWSWDKGRSSAEMCLRVEIRLPLADKATEYLHKQWMGGGWSGWRLTLKAKNCNVLTYSASWLQAVQDVSYFPNTIKGLSWKLSRSSLPSQGSFPAQTHLVVLLHWCIGILHPLQRCHCKSS